ncbi:MULTISPECIES: rhomboid family intramembrane serine protease [unclassified Lactobacillus]|uniref:rhomboid family intramembrane serine protease n=1 Tax=unclassified Lactobacillus TaxID=2620435 RepID=UPI0023F6329F|nr:MULTISPECIES: rhomboid family intramembrane serine protease [unclassified Lactobacillus]WEV36408.1 rhomboid family intramembrane serine protease [Lactobacillus sp. ESL0677]WEV50538.1 rhomboid family intramembrane serine protease [Lactobacillus sp. ESL0700]WEV61668.1 rhomboid family intramembrane serine protease [Lactobacillus sp. ESL0731]
MQKQSFKDSYMTWIILIVLFVVFLMETALGGSQNTAVLIKMGAMSNYAVVAGGQWWRLFTAQFLHMGIMHIVSNAVMIYYLGVYMEQILGHWRFLAVYLLSGIGGNLLSLALGSDQAISAGASTALFGLMGAMTAIGLRNRDNPVLVYLGKQALWLAVINIVLDLFDTNIDIQGHIGGLITGLLLAIILGDRALQKYSTKWRIVALCVLIVYLVATVRMGMVIRF